jgi:hypothetical protein
MMDPALAQHYLENATTTFRGYKILAEKALQQITDAELFRTLDEEANSIALIMKHMSGNMLSRWTNFLTTDGEKPTRNRDAEFITESEDTKEKILAQWEKGWHCLFTAMEALQPVDLSKSVTIRGAKLSVLEAINRQLTHKAYHVGQIVFLAKHFKSKEWQSLSVPRGQSAAHTAAVQQAQRDPQNITRLAEGKK